MLRDTDIPTDVPTDMCKAICPSFFKGGHKNKNTEQNKTFPLCCYSDGIYKRKSTRSNSVLSQKPYITLTKNKSKVTTQKRNQNFDYKTIADRLRSVSCSNDLHRTGVVKPVYGIVNFQLTAKHIIL